MVWDSNSGHQQLLLPANFCPIFAPRTAHAPGEVAAIPTTASCFCYSGGLDLTIDGTICGPQCLDKLRQQTGVDTTDAAVSSRLGSFDGRRRRCGRCLALPRTYPSFGTAAAAACATDPPPCRPPSSTADSQLVHSWLSAGSQLVPHHRARSTSCSAAASCTSMSLMRDPARPLHREAAHDSVSLLILPAPSPCRCRLPPPPPPRLVKPVCAFPHAA